MKKTIDRLQNGPAFESSSTKTPEFMAFVRTFKKELIADLAARGCGKAVFSVGHFYITVFFTDLKSGQVWYLNTGDVRWFARDNWLLRTAKDYKDYSGGSNTWLALAPDMIERARLTV